MSSESHSGVTKQKKEGLDRPPPPPPQEKPIETGPVLKDRTVDNLNTETPHAYSKEHMTVERSRLAAEIRAERVQIKESLSGVRIRANLYTGSVERSTDTAETAGGKLDAFEDQRSQNANQLANDTAEYITSSTEKADLSRGEELRVGIDDLVEADESLKKLKEKIVEHYGSAAKELEMQKRTVEQSMLRNNAFFVHTINENEEYRHNANSNVSRETSFEDDLDIILSLEPSISASSLISGTDAEGNVSGLWSTSGGVLLAGGSISAADVQDAGTISQSIKERYAFTSSRVNSHGDIDKAVQRDRTTRPAERGGYNEFVINNPEVAGYFKSAAFDEQGNLWAGDLWMKDALEEVHTEYARNSEGIGYRRAMHDFENNVKRYRARFDEIKMRGLPFYAMTPDRRFLEVKGVNDNGTLDVGEELTPEKAATGSAGLTGDKRKEIGTKLLGRRNNLFTKEETVEEARNIVGSL